MIFVLFDMPSTLRMYAVFQRILFYGGGVGKFNPVSQPLKTKGFFVSLTPPAPIAQLDRASDYGSGGWGFNSLWAHQLQSL